MKKEKRLTAQFLVQDNDNGAELMVSFMGAESCTDVADMATAAIEYVTQNCKSDKFITRGKTRGHHLLVEKIF